MQDKDYFVLTTNVDHQFQKAGFDKQRLFYTQGDYGLFQARHPVTARTYDNEAVIVAMMEAQGFVYDSHHYFVPPEKGTVSMQVPAELLPRSPEDGQDLVLNLRCDDTFVEDAGWKAAARRYQQFLQDHQQGRVLYLELGVGMNTPGIIKIPFGSTPRLIRRPSTPASMPVMPAVRNGSAGRPSASKGISPMYSLP